MFIAKSLYLQKIKKIADMAKELKLSVYIWGERGVGKSFLAKYIAPNAILNPSTPTINPVIIEDFDKSLTNYAKNILIATGLTPLPKEILNKFFNLDINLKPLKEHPEDIDEFAKLFLQKAKEELKIQKEISLKNLDISENLNSLKRDIYKRVLFPNSKEEILNMLTQYYMHSHKSYEEELNDFERALFKAMKQKYESKLKISQELKINRVTLTKKMKVLDV